MGDELTRYQKDLIRMWDSLRTEVFKGVRTCAGVLCSKCPFDHATCNTDDGASMSFKAEKAIEIVTQWAKEHPIITMRDKYKETFGVEPVETGWRRNAKTYLCPKYAGFDIGTCPVPIICSDCAECKEKFWNSEFKKWKVTQNGK